MFNGDIQGRDCGDEVSRWFTRYLGGEKTFRMVHFEPQMKARRSVDSEPVFPQNEVVHQTLDLLQRHVCLFILNFPDLLPVCIRFRFVNLSPTL